MTDLQDHHLLLHTVSAGSDSGDQGEGGPELSQKEAPMFLKDYERKRLLERGTLALVSDSEEEEEEGEGLERKKKKVGTHVVMPQCDASLLDSVEYYVDLQ